MNVAICFIWILVYRSTGKKADRPLVVTVEDDGKDLIPICSSVLRGMAGTIFKNRIEYLKVTPDD